MSNLATRLFLAAGAAIASPSINQYNPAVDVAPNNGNVISDTMQTAAPLAFSSGTYRVTLGTPANAQQPPGLGGQPGTAPGGQNPPGAGGGCQGSGTCADQGGGTIIRGGSVRQQQSQGVNIGGDVLTFRGTREVGRPGGVYSDVAETCGVATGGSISFIGFGASLSRSDIQERCNDLAVATGILYSPNSSPMERARAWGAINRLSTSFDESGRMIVSNLILNPACFAKALKADPAFVSTTPLTPEFCYALTIYELANSPPPAIAPVPAGRGRGHRPPPPAAEVNGCIQAIERAQHALTTAQQAMARARQICPGGQGLTLGLGS